MQNLNSKFKTNLVERCYKFSIAVIELTNNLPNKRSAWVITDQLIRSATSIGANIVEAKASSSRREFKNFYQISLKSSNETIYWLNLLRDTKLTEVSPSILQEAIELSRMLGASVISLKKS